MTNVVYKTNIYSTSKFLLRLLSLRRNSYKIQSRVTKQHTFQCAVRDKQLQILESAARLFDSHQGLRSTSDKPF